MWQGRVQGLGSGFLVCSRFLVRFILSPDNLLYYYREAIPTPIPTLHVYLFLTVNYKRPGGQKKPLPESYFQLYSISCCTVAGVATSLIDSSDKARPAAAAGELPLLKCGCAIQQRYLVIAPT